MTESGVPSVWDGVDDLTCDVVTTAGALLTSLRTKPPAAAAALPLRAFATTMSRVVAHLTEVGIAETALTGPGERAPAAERAEVQRQGRNAWRAAVFALTNSTQLIEIMQAAPGVDVLARTEPAFARLRALREPLAATLARVEPAEVSEVGAAPDRVIDLVDRTPRAVAAEPRPRVWWATVS
jgi:hypothetical protein